MDTHSKEALSSLTFAQVGAVAKSLMAKWSVFDRVGHLDYSFLDKLAHVRVCAALSRPPSPRAPSHRARRHRSCRTPKTAARRTATRPCASSGKS